MPSPLTPSNRAASAKVLSELLPSLRTLGLTAQDAHWRVRGPMFSSLHALFGDLYSFVSSTYADAVAERIAQFLEAPPQQVTDSRGFNLPADGAELCSVLSRLIMTTGSKDSLKSTPGRLKRISLDFCREALLASRGA